MSEPGTYTEPPEWTAFEIGKLSQLARDIDAATEAYRDSGACFDNQDTEWAKVATTNYIMLVTRLIGDQLTVRELLQLAKLIGADSYI